MGGVGSNHQCGQVHTQVSIVSFWSADQVWMDNVTTLALSQVCFQMYKLSLPIKRSPWSIMSSFNSQCKSGSLLFGPRNTMLCQIAPVSHSVFQLWLLYIWWHSKLNLTRINRTWMVYKVNLYINMLTFVWSNVMEMQLGLHFMQMIHLLWFSKSIETERLH